MKIFRKNTSGIIRYKKELDEAKIANQILLYGVLSIIALLITAQLILPIFINYIK